MGNNDSRPIIFAAFANDHVDGVRYLRNLSEEARSIRKALGKAEKLCEVVVRQNATAEEIFDVFRDCRDRVVIFHYGGHANGFQLLLESADGAPEAIHAGGLAGFLGQQYGLKLVFLNGCSTEPQVERLLQANVSAVIATSQAIDDSVATAFAGHFYSGLASGRTVQSSYEEAKAATIAVKSGNLRALYFGDAPPDEPATTERWPWNIHLRTGAETATEWNLPDAADDPLFNLPSLPELYLPPSPYQYLHRFRREQARVFFGRGHKTRELYHKVTDGTDYKKAPIVLFHGQSGVGKSSLLEAGLAPRLEARHEFLYLRRDREAGLLETLKQGLDRNSPDRSVLELWLDKESRGAKPLIVILDQVEEVFTRPGPQPSEQEFQDCFGELQETFLNQGSRPGGTLILGFRKEWLPEIAKQLTNHQLPPALVFLERLDRRGIIEAIRLSSELRTHYGLTVEQGLAETIARDLVADQESPIAPTLQILLSTMWEAATRISPSKPVFDQALYSDLKKRGIHLGDFLDKQINQIAVSRKDVVDSGMALDVLAFHTTPLGTAEQKTQQELHESYGHREADLDWLVGSCKDLYLLVDPSDEQIDVGRATRLSHDTLAPLVRKRFDESDRPGQRARRILDTRTVEWAQGKTGPVLDDTDLATVESGQSGTRIWNETELRLVQSSQSDRNTRKRNRTIWKGLGVIALAAIVFLAAWLVLLNSKLESSLKKEEEARISAEARSASLLSFLPGMGLEALTKAIRLCGECTRSGSKITAENVEALTRSISVVRNNPFLFEDAEGAGLGFFSHDGRHLVTTWGNSAARIWNTATRSSVMLSPDDSASISSAAFSTDGRFVATGHEDGTILIWEARSGHLRRRLKRHHARVNSLAFCPDSPSIVLVSGSNDKTARIWDISSDKPEKILDPHSDEVVFVSTSKNGCLILTLCGEHVVTVWDRENEYEKIFTEQVPAWFAAFCRSSPDRAIKVVRDGKVTEMLDSASRHGWEIDGKPGRVRQASVLRTASELRIVAERADCSSPYDDCALSLFDGKSGKLISRLSGHRRRVNGVVFTIDGTRFATFSFDRTTRIWDARNGAAMAILRGHGQDVQFASFSPDGMQLLTISKGFTTGLNSARLWKLTGPGQAITAMRALYKPISHVAFSPDGRQLVTIGQNHRVGRLWLFEKGRIKASPAGEHEGKFLILPPPSGGHSGAFSPDGAYVVHISHGKLFLRDAKSLKIKLKSDKVFDKSRWRHLTFSRSGKLLAITEFNGTLRLYDVQAGKLLDPPMDMGGRIAWPASFSHDDQLVATAVKGSPVGRVWNTSTRKLHAELKGPNGHKAGLMSIAFSPNDNHIVTTSLDSTARVWNGQTGKLVRVLKGHTNVLRTAKFSTDGKHIVTAGEDATPRIWDLASGEPVAALTGHEDWVTSASFSKDGTRVLTCSQDGTARIWEVPTGKPLAVLGEVNCSTGLLLALSVPLSLALFSPDEESRWVITADEEGMLRVYPGTVSGFMEMGCELIKHDPEFDQVRKICGPGLQ